jgi:two-component system, LytTR family, sensor kinase
MPTSRSRTHSHRWIWIGSIWLSLGLLDAALTMLTMHAEGMHHSWGRLFVSSVLYWIPWALATAPIMRLGQLYSLTQWRSVKPWLVHLSACVAVGALCAAWYTRIYLTLNPYARPRPLEPFHTFFVKVFAEDILLAIILYTAIQCVNYVLDFRARLVQQQAETARLNEQLSKAQLDAVRRQIEPHFLFNTLNSVSALIRENRNDAAVMMIAGLSDFLRRLLQDPTRQQVPLAEEMEFAQKYLDIQKVRFVDRLQLTIDVPTDLLFAQVPTLILQLMLENAIKHGIAKRAQGGLVRISASRDNGTLTLSVYNDGPALPATISSPPGIGLTNMRTRLQGLYGDRFALDMRNQQPGGVEVCVSVPFIEH